MQDLEQAMRQELAVGRESMEQEAKTPETKEWRPSNQEVLQEYELSIRFLSRGCVVRVGCKEIAFEDVNKAMVEINEYVSGNTYEVQKKWRKLLNM
jgi:ethanolamine utilization cobalamin adenosyltransferase